MTTLNPGRVRRTETQWRQILRQYERSGLSAAAFCRRQSLTLSSLRRWQKKLGAESPSITPPSDDTREFVEVAMSESPSAFWAIEIEMPDGRVLRMRG